MRHTCSLLAFALPVAFGISTAFATTIFLDTFTDGARTNGTDPTDVAWYETIAASTTSIANAGSSTITVGNNSLFIDTAGDFRGLVANFAEAGSGVGGTLNIGEGYTLSMDIKSVVLATNSAGIRIGLSSSAGNPYTADGVSANTGSHVGYYAAYSTSFSPAQVQPFEDNGGTTINTGTVTALGGVVTATSFNTNLLRSVVFSVLRTSSTETTITSTMYDGTGGTGTPLSTFSVVDAASAYFNFNQVAITAGNTTLVDISMDNVKLEYVPEPRAALLGGFGMLALLRRRRH